MGVGEIRGSKMVDLELGEKGCGGGLRGRYRAGHRNKQSHRVVIPS